MRVTIDTTELVEAVADMRAIPGSLTRYITPVLRKGALNIKNQLQAEARASAHFKGFAPGITFEDAAYAGFGGGEMRVDIGPEKGAPGSLANIAYFGTSRGGGTVPDPIGALEAEAPRFEKALSELIEELL